MDILKIIKAGIYKITRNKKEKMLAHNIVTVQERNALILLLMLFICPILAAGLTVILFN